jgi:hypothetical protein
VIVGSGGDQVQWNPLPVGRNGELQAVFAPVDGRAPGHLTTAGRLRDG